MEDEPEDRPEGQVREEVDDVGTEHAERRVSRREDKRFQRLLRDRHELHDTLGQREARIADLERQLATHTTDAGKARVESLTSDLERTRDELRTAQAEGDPDRAADLALKLAELAADRKAVQVQTEHEPPPPRQQAPQQRLRPEVQDWMERNTWFKPQANKASNTPQTKLALIAHNEAIEVEGLDANTPEYFTYIEDRVDQRFPGTVEREDTEYLEEPELDEQPPRRAPQQPQYRQQPRPAATRGPAPVGRGAALVARPQSRSAALPKPTLEDAEHAKVSGVSIQDYMAAKAVRLRNGTLEPRRG
jgi:hypothetical protein